MDKANPTLDIELEGYDRNGAPGMMRAKGGPTKRAKGGSLPKALKEHDEEEEEKRRRKRSGGKVMGKAAMKRPDKRARGGATGASDEHPLTSAGKMNKQSFEKTQEGNYGGGEGADTKGEDRD